jgi:hypothetical protein
MMAMNDGLARSIRSCAGARLDAMGSSCSSCSFAVVEM